MARPLQQIWRDHLLAGVLRAIGGYADGYFLLLHPAGNSHCAAAVAAYRQCLTGTDTFASLTLEALVTEMRRHTSADWVRNVYDRYLDFQQVESQLAAS